MALETLELYVDRIELATEEQYSSHASIDLNQLQDAVLVRLGATRACHVCTRFKPLGPFF